MAEERSLNSLVTMPVLLAVITLAASLLWPHSPLRSPRPAGAPDKSSAESQAQDVEARLWQDPFEAAVQHEQLRSTAGQTTNTAAPLTETTWHGQMHNPSMLSNRIADVLLRRTNALQILVAVETGRPYPEDHESRLRSRFAVLSALNVAGYVPEDAQHLGYVRHCWTATESTNGLGGRTYQTLVPFEWFERSDLAQPTRPQPASLLVLWFEEGVPYGSPLRALAELAKTLGVSGRTNVVIGPRSSGALKAMLTDTNTYAARWKFFSSWASASDLVLAGRKTTPSRSRVVAQLSTNGVGLRAIGCTDQELLALLIDELELRHIDISSAEPRDHVALISEWDSSYGRAMPFTFRAELAWRQGHLKRQDFTLQEALGAVSHVTNVLTYSYLKGLDGILPAGAKNQGKESDASSRALEAEQLERPTGESQLDAVPRIVARLKQIDSDLRRGNPQGGLKAIGVLGSDVYDKLLLLQSLREGLPGQVLFTTDLDARYWHSDSRKWNRNLLVASSFGLIFPYGLQRDIGPFRDAYQAGQFLACLQAVGFTSESGVAEALRKAGLTPPRVLEIGRHGPFDLQRRPRSMSPKYWLYAESTLVGPESASGLKAGEWVQFVLKFAAVCAGMLVLLYLSLGMRNSLTTIWLLIRGRYTEMPHPFSRQPVWCVWAQFITLVSLFGGVALAAAWCHSNPQEEPFSLTEGISVWPTELIRIFAFCLAVGFLNQARRDLREDREALSGRFHLPEPIPDGEACQRLWDALWDSRFSEDDLLDPQALARKLNDAPDPVSSYLRSRFSEASRRTLKHCDSPEEEDKILRRLFVRELNQIVGGGPIYEAGRFADVRLGSTTGLLVQTEPKREGLVQLNRLLLEDAYPQEIRRKTVRPVTPAPAGVGYLWERIKRWWSLWPWIGIRSWHLNCGPDGKVDAANLWEDYSRRSHFNSRCARIWPGLIVYVLAAILTVLWLGIPSSPLRGEWTLVIDKLALLLSGLALIFLNFFVMDAAHLCVRLVEHLTGRRTLWPEDTVRGFENQLGLGREYLREWVDIRIIASLTKAVSRLIYYPFAIIFLMILSRTHFLDGWSWPWSLILIYGVNLILAGYSVFVLRKAAERMRSSALESMRLRLVKTMGETTGSGAKLLDQLRWLVESVESCREGPFAPWTSQPVVRGLLMLLGGGGLLPLLGYFGYR